MAFTCPDCSTRGSLHITLSLELPPDSRSDEITLQLVGCQRCGFRGVAIYEESRRGALDSEHWDHTGYRVEEEVLASLTRTMEACPDPRNARCSCKAHRTLRNRSPSGRWLMPEGLGWPNQFSMER
jgi:hypothetical protein